LWQSGRPQVVTLLDEDPNLFDIFLAWLTTGNVESSSEFIAITGSKENKAEVIEQRHQQWEQLRRCYCLGDDLLVRAFKHAVIDCLITVSDYLITDHNVLPCRTVQKLEIVYDSTYPGSDLRKLVVDLAVKCMGIESFYDLDKVSAVLLFDCCQM